jgi:hypothetical protein
MIPLQLTGDCCDRVRLVDSTRGASPRLALSNAPHFPLRVHCFDLDDTLLLSDQAPPLICWMIAPGRLMGGQP